MGSQLNVEVPDKLKEQFVKKCEQIGCSHASVLKKAIQEFVNGEKENTAPELAKKISLETEKENTAALRKILGDKKFEQVGGISGGDMFQNFLQQCVDKHIDPFSFDKEYDTVKEVVFRWAKYIGIDPMDYAFLKLKGHYSDGKCNRERLAESEKFRSKNWQEGRQLAKVERIKAS
jgi:hypothetical protein